MDSQRFRSLLLDAELTGATMSPLAENLLKALAHKLCLSVEETRRRVANGDITVSEQSATLHQGELPGTWASNRSRRNKYGNKRTEIDGIVFASKKEARRWLELKAMRDAGEIYNLERQRVFDLRVIDQLICRYVSDFCYWKICGDNKGRLPEFVVEDVKCKATKTPVYRIKAKLMKALFEIEIVEV
jgi:hypothetical protein